MASSECTVSVRPGEPPVITAAGEFSYETAGVLRQAFADLQSRGYTHVAVDCAEMQFIDSSGIGSIARAADDLKSAGGMLVLRSPGHQLMHALNTLGLASRFDIESPLPPAAHDRMARSANLPRCSFSLPLKPEMSADARRRICEFVEGMPFCDHQLDDIKLAVGEAIANAVRHGCPDREASGLIVRCVGEADKVVISITNPGDPFDADAVPIPIPEHMREGGMGIYCMRSAMDSVEYCFAEDWTTVTMTKYLESTLDTDDGNNPAG